MAAGACAFLALLFLTPCPSQANGFDLGDAANYAVLYTGSKNFQVNSNSTVNGNIGIGVNGTVTNYGAINGYIDFSSASGQYTTNPSAKLNPSDGNPRYSRSNITTDLTYLSTLSAQLGGESGKQLTISPGGSVNASSGLQDSNGNFVFSATISNLNGGTFTINGNSSDHVVFNLSSSIIDGSFVLNGIPIDNVLFNSTGNQLTFQNVQTPTYGTFLAPNATITTNSGMILYGHLFGGDSSNFQLNSGSTINNMHTPIPASSLLLGSGLLGLGVMGYRRKRHC